MCIAVEGEEVLAGVFRIAAPKGTWHSALIFQGRGPLAEAMGFSGGAPTG